MFALESITAANINAKGALFLPPLFCFAFQFGYIVVYTDIDTNDSLLGFRSPSEWNAGEEEEEREKDKVQESNSLFFQSGYWFCQLNFQVDTV